MFELSFNLKFMYVNSIEKNNNFTTSLNAQQNLYQNGWSIIVLLLHATSNLSVRNRIGHAFLEFDYSWKNWWKKPLGYSSGLWGFWKINFEIILISCFEQGPLMYCRLRTEFNINMYSPLNGCWCSLSLLEMQHYWMILPEQPNQRSEASCLIDRR